jgi:hypothetical protein
MAGADARHDRELFRWRAKEALQKWLLRGLAALRELLRCSFIAYKLRASKSSRLALGHARTFLESLLKSCAVVSLEHEVRAQLRHPCSRTEQAKKIRPLVCEPIWVFCSPSRTQIRIGATIEVRCLAVSDCRHEHQRCLTDGVRLTGRSPQHQAVPLRRGILSTSDLPLYNAGI